MSYLFDIEGFMTKSFFFWCRRRLGVVTQNPTLFIGTIFSNITYGCPGASLADAIEAARMANALDFINSFPDGFYTDGKCSFTQVESAFMIVVYCCVLLTHLRSW